MSKINNVHLTYFKAYKEAILKSIKDNFSDKCDYSIAGDKDAYLKEYKEYIDEKWL